MTNPPAPAITHDADARRFHAKVDGGLAVAAYERRNGAMVLTHTTVPPQSEGQGVGSALAREALGFARSEGLRVVAECPFMAAYLERHPEHGDLR